MGEEPGNELDRIRRAYAGTLPDKLARLAAAWRERPPALASVRDQAHQIAGSAPMLGFAAVGDGAARVEEAAMSLLGEGGTGTPRDAATPALEAALADLGLAVAAAVAAPAAP